MSYKKKEILKEFLTRVVDADTGEITNEESYTVLKYPREPNFAKQYHADIASIFGLPKVCRGVLDLIVAKMDYDNRVLLFAPIKREICQILDIKMQSVDKTIQSLNKHGIIKRLDRGMYRVNPFLYGKGEWKDIYKLRLTTDYGKDGIKILGERITQEKEEKEKKT